MSRGSNQGFRARPETRLAIKLRDEFLCLYCGADLSDAAFNEVTVDHLKAQTKRGTHNKSNNVITACRSCNCSRQDKPWQPFAIRMGGRVAVARILRNTARDIRPYRQRAKKMLANGYADRSTHCRKTARRTS